MSTSSASWPAAAAAHMALLHTGAALCCTAAPEADGCRTEEGEGIKSLGVKETGMKTSVGLRRGGQTSRERSYS